MAENTNTNTIELMPLIFILHPFPQNLFWR